MTNSQSQGNRLSFGSLLVLLFGRGKATATVHDMMLQTLKLKQDNIQLLTCIPRTRRKQLLYFFQQGHACGIQV